MLEVKKTLLACAISSLALSSSLYAGTMGAAMDEQGPLLLLEGGASYMHAIYLNNVVGAQSVTTISPAGYSYNPSVVQPNDFAGGYIELSLFRKSLLFNTRYDMYALKGQSSDKNQVLSHYAPAKLSFTLDKTWETPALEKFVYGVGAGVVVSTHNQAEFFNYDPAIVPISKGQIGFSYPGRTRIDPLVEAVVMYGFYDNFNIRANAAYQIPEHSFYTNGHVNVNLGINYALPL